MDPYGGPDEPDPDLHHPHPDPDFDAEYEDDDDQDYDPDLYSDLRREGMYDWESMLRQARSSNPTVIAHDIQNMGPATEVGFFNDFPLPHHLREGASDFLFEAAAVPSQQWEDTHSTSSVNPADTAPADFGEPLDPMDRHNIFGQPHADEALLAPGPVLRDPAQGLSQWFAGVTASKEPVAPPQMPQEGMERPEWLNPKAAASGGSQGLVGSTPPPRGDTELASAMDHFLRTGTLVGTEGSMVHEALKTFTPEEQDEMIHEGEADGARAS